MTYRRSRALVVAAAAAIALSWRMLAGAQAGAPSCGLDMRVLVVSADGGEADLPAIKQALDYLGTPYDTYVGTQHAAGLTASLLANGCRGFYNGIILTTNVAVSAGEFQTLATYENAFGIRQVTWYTWPTPDFGFNWATSASSAAVTVQATTAGTQVFSYLKVGTGATPIPIQYSWIYHATPLDSSTTPLLTDPEGHALAAVHRYPDGRENLALTFDSNPSLLHSMVLAYGVVNWVTRGMFIGARHVYMSPQVDDIFLPNVVWTPATPCLVNVDLTGVETRMTEADLEAVFNWQTARRLQPLTADMRLTLAFNGEGTMGGYGPDSLTPAAQLRQDAFLWVSHTWDHQNLDAINYANATTEITLNNAKATELGLTRYSALNLVQPDVSGLDNGNFLRSARDAGIRYLLSDTSKPGQENPTPNTGRWSALRPEIFVIPRRPNNLFFNAPNPAAWVTEYNCLYNSYWGRNLTYSEIVDVESQTLLTYLLQGELDLWMFHQANLVAYDGVHTLLTDLIDRTLAKYQGFFTLPILSPSMDVIGNRMANRTAWRAAGISGTLTAGGLMTILSPVDVTLPVTGLHRPGAESYGGQWITWLTLTANQSVTLPTVLAPTAAAGPAQTVPATTTVSLNGTGVDANTPPLALTYAWVQTAGPAVALANANSQTPTFTAPALNNGASPVSLTFALTVSNGVPLINATASTTVTVTAPPIVAPAVSVGPTQTAAGGVTVSLSSAGQDYNTPLRPLTYAWTQTDGTPAVALTNAATATPTFIAPTLNNGASAATLTFQVRVSNGVPALDVTATTTVTVNAPPIVAATVTAGAAQTVAGGVTVSLSSAGVDHNTPLRPLTYAWTQAGGTPTVTLANATSATPTFTSPTLNNGAPAATLTFQVQVSNGVPALDVTATTTVTVNAPPIVAATVTAGAAQTVAGGVTVSLSSAGVDHNTPLRPLTYAWTQTSGTPAVTLANANTSAPSFVAPTLNNGASAATLTFQVRVSNGVPALDVTATTTVTVNAPPIVAATVTAGAAQTVAGGVTVSLSSAGVDHNTPLRPLTYAWTQTSGTPAVTLANAATATPTFIAPTLNNGASAATLTFQVRVSNGVPALDVTATTTVTVNAPPIVAATVTAGAAQTVGGGVTVSLSSAGVDHNTPLRPLTYAWTQAGGTPTVTLANATSATPTFTSPTLNNGAPAATLTFQVQVSNGVPALDVTATTTVTVNAPPIVAATVTAGAAQTVAGGVTVSLSSAGVDHNTPLRPLTYAWTQTSGTPTVTLANAATATPTFVAPTLNNGAPAATLTFQVTVSNGVPALDVTATTTVTVNAPPIVAATVTAGAAQTVAGGVTVSLSSAGVDHNTPLRPLTYAWTQTGGTPTVTLANATSATPTFTSPTLNNGASAATLTFQVQVSNGVPALDVTATTTVTVNAPPIVGPTASAGGAQTVTSGATVSLAGAGQDHNTPLRPLTYAWTQTDGTPAVTLTGAATATPTFIAPTLNNGADPVVLTFVLTVSNGLPALDATTTTTVTVNAPPIVAPTVSAGGAQTVAGGVTVSLSSIGVDHNTPLRPLTYAWTQTDGTPAVTLTNAATVTPTFIAPTLNNGANAATLTFQVRVSNGVPALDATTTTTVTVNAPPIVAPTVSAGGSQTVAGGVTVSLSSTGTDHNTPLRPLTYAWTQTDGTPSVTLTNATTATPTFIAPMLNNGIDPTTLTFQVRVSNGVPALDATATTTVTVNAPPMAAPTATAGAPQFVIENGPVTLHGAGADHNTPLRPLTFAWTQLPGTPVVSLANASSDTPTFTAPSMYAEDPPITLTFALKVSNGIAALDTTATTSVTVTPLPVAAPTAGAGGPQTAGPGAQVTLAGSGADPNLPPRALTFAWTQTGGLSVALSGASTLSPTFTAPTLNNGADSAVLTFVLTVSNGVPALDATATTTVTVNAPPIVAPTASAGGAQTVAGGVTVSLSSAGVDHNTPLRPLTYAWTQTDGTPAVTLTNAATATPTFIAPTLNNGADAATLTFQVRVSNGVPALDATATTTVTVNAPPIVPPTVTVNAPPAVPSGAPVALSATGEDHNTPPRPLTYGWTQTDGPVVSLTNAATAAPTFIAPTLNNGVDPIALTFKVTVSNGAGGTGALTLQMASASSLVPEVSATTTVTVMAPPIAAPTAGAGVPQVVASAASVTLIGTGQDHNTPLRPLTYNWIQTAGTPVALVNATSASPTFTAPTLGNGADPAELTFALTVSNAVPALDATATTSVMVNAPPIVAPTASAGIAQTVPAGATVTLSGAGEDHNAPERPLTYAWTQTSGTPVELQNAQTVHATFTSPTPPNGETATLTFLFTVSNGVPALNASAGTTVTVEGPPVLAPDGNAGPAQTVASGSFVSLAAIAEDHNTPARPLSYAWTQTAGTPVVVLTGANTRTPSFTAPTLNNGADSSTLTFQVTVSNGVSALDVISLMTVTVTAPPVLAPVALAGPPQTAHSEALVALAGAGEDHNSPLRSLSYAWTQTQGTPVVLLNPDTPAPSFIAPPVAPGSGSTALTFMLTVSNGVPALAATATTTVTVESATPVLPPLAAAGPTQSVVSATPVTLSGSASDPNVPARPLAVTWQQTSGPAAVLTGAGTLTPSFVAPSLPAGDPPTPLGFAMKADNGVMSATANTTVVVTPVVQQLAVTQTLIADGLGTQTTTPFNASAGDLLVALVTADGAASPKQSLTISGGALSWTLVRRVNAQSGTAEVWSAKASAPVSSMTVSSTPAVTGYQQSLTVLTFTGAAGIGTTTAGATGTTAAASVTLITKRVGSLIYAAGLDWDRAASRIPDPDATITREYLSPANSTHWVQTLTSGFVPTPNATVQIGSTGPAGDHWNLAAVEVTPLLLAPSASAGLLQTVEQGSNVTLTALASDPNVPARPLSVAWTQTSGPAVTLIDADTAAATFAAPSLPPEATTVSLGFMVTVSNGLLSTSSAVTVLVRAAPMSGALIAAPLAYSDGLGPRTTPPFDVAEGEWLAAFVSSDGPATPKQTTTVAGGGLQWTLASRANGQPGTGEIWTARAPSSMVGVTVTSTQSTTTGSTGGYYQSLTIVKFAGAGGFGAGANAGGATGAPTVSLTTTRAGSQVFGVANNWDRAVAPTLPADQALVHQVIGPMSDAHWVQTLVSGAIPSSGTGVQLRDTAPTTDHWNFAAVEVLSGVLSPVASAGQAQTVSPGSQVTLAGTATDPNTPARPLTISWTQTSGTPVSLNSSDTATPTFVAPALAPGQSVTLGFTLAVTNGFFATTATTTVVVRAQPLPVTVGTTVFSDGLGKRTTAPFNAAAGDLLVAFVSSDGPASPKQTSTVAGGGLTWTLARRVNTQGGTAEIWTATTASALTGVTVSSTQSVTSSGSASAYYQSLTLVTFSGAAAGANAGASAGSGAPTVSVTTTKAGSWIYAVGVDFNHAAARTVASSQTMVHQFLGTMNDSHWVQMLTASPVPTSGTVIQMRDTAPTNDSWNFAAIEITVK